MTADQFVAALDAIETTQIGFAALIKRNPRTIRRWAAGRAEVPTEIAILLNVMFDMELTAEDVDYGSHL